jgi:hypothetical protein
MPTHRSATPTAVARLVAGLITGLASAAGPTAAGAQPSAPPLSLAGRPRPVVTQTAAVNLLALPVGFASGEYERAVGSGFALGIGGVTSLGFAPGNDDDVYGGSFDERLATAQLKLKYYPAENGLRGLAVGLTAGVAHFGRSERTTVFDPATGSYLGAGPAARRTKTAPTVGAVVDYNFLLGRRRRFLVGVGIGARRALGVRDRDPLDATLPDGRLQIGFGF